MTHALSHFVSIQYKFDLMRYKKSANAESFAETTWKNGSAAMRFAAIAQNFAPMQVAVQSVMQSFVQKTAAMQFLTPTE